MDTQLNPSTLCIARSKLRLPSGDMAHEGDLIGPYLKDNKKHRWCTEAWISDALRAGHLRQATETELAPPAPRVDAKAAEAKKAKADAKKVKADAKKVADKKKADTKARAAEKKRKAAPDKKAKAEVNKKKREAQKKGSSTPKLPPPKD